MTNSLLSILAVFLLFTAFARCTSSSPPSTPPPPFPRPNTTTLSLFSSFHADPFGPCSHAEPTWTCNTKQFCDSAANMHRDDCYFMPYYCMQQCYIDIIALNKTDCMEHPSDPFLENFARKVRHSAETWNFTCHEQPKQVYLH